MKTLLKELTPEAYMCAGGMTCPSVFETDEGTLVVIGKTVSEEVREQLKGRVAPDEALIEIPRGLVAGIDK
jgi:hypothetical protein